MSITKQLEDFDNQIAKRRQQINVLRVEIAQIEDARRTALWLEEERGNDARPLSEHQQGILSGRSERPMMIVRDTTADDDGAASRAAKYGSSEKPPKKVRSSPKGSQRGLWSTRILDFLREAEEPVTCVDICNYYGLPIGEEHRKPVQNAIYNLKIKGLVALVAGGGSGKRARYRLPAKGNGSGHAAH